MAQEHGMRVFGFAGWSGSGKTTLIERLIPLFVQRGLRVSLIKHAHHDFDVVLMDVHMPGMDGFETTKAIRELNDKYKSVPIIVITALALKEEADKFLSAGMDDIIYKPFKIVYFLEKIDGWLKIQNSLISS